MAITEHTDGEPRTQNQEETNKGSILENFATEKLTSATIIKNKDITTLDYIRLNYNLLKKTLENNKEEITNLTRQNIANGSALDKIVELHETKMGTTFNNEEWQNNFHQILADTFEMAAYSKKPFEIIKNTRDTVNNYITELNLSIDKLILQHQEGIKIKTNIPDTEKFYEITGNFETNIQNKLFTKPMVAYTKMNLNTMLAHIKQELKPAKSEELSEWVEGELLRSHNSLIERIETHVKTVYETAVETIPEVFKELTAIYSSDRINRETMKYVTNGKEDKVILGIIRLVEDYSQKYFNHVMKKDIERLERLEVQKETILKAYSKEDKSRAIVFKTLEKDYEIEATQMLNTAIPAIKTINESTDLSFKYGELFVERIHNLYKIN